VVCCGICQVFLISASTTGTSHVPELSKPSRPRISPAVATFALLLALNFLNYIDRYVLPGEQPLIQHQFNATDQQMGALTTAFFLAYMIVAPLSGWLGDWFRRKPLIIIGAILWCLATLSSGFAHTYWTLYIRRAVVGVGEATFGIYAPAVLADFYPDRERNRVLSIFYLAIPVGAALGYLAGGELGSHYGWPAPFFICAVPGLAVALLYIPFGHEPVRGAADRVRPARNHSAAEFLRNFRTLLTNPAFLTSTFGMAQITFALGGISAWVPTYLHRQIGLSVADSSLVVSAITVIDGIAGTITGGWIAQRWQRRDHRALYLVSFWSTVLALPFGVLVFFGPRVTVIPALFAAEFFIFLNTGPLNAAIVNSVGAAVRATAISLELFCIHFFGDTFSPQLIGALSDRTNLSIGLGATLISLAIASVILWYGARFAPPLTEPAA
jgi:MFS transporter, Spinster family, sphingosine-1-phosphate transporter